MQPRRRRLAPLALALALATLLPGCTFPWDRTQESVDPDSTYTEGAGAQLIVINDGNHTFTARILLRDPVGEIVGQSNMTLEPGDRETRRFATPHRGALTASIQYHFTGGGRAATGLDDRVLESADCDRLRTGSWTLANVGESAGAQWRDEGCQDP